MDSTDYAIGVFDGHVKKSGLENELRDKTILELGPGDSIATAIIAASHGARAIIVDAGRFVREDMSSYARLACILNERGLTSVNVSTCRNVNEILAGCNATYMTDGLESLRKIETESIDMIFSQAVLEHVRKWEFLHTMQECRRILKPCGVCSHRVDLRDHLGGALNNLRFSAKIWESDLFSNSGFYTNRINFREMLRLFKEAGFNIEVTSVSRWDKLPTRQERMAREFRSLAPEELTVSGFDVLLRRKMN